MHQQSKTLYHPDGVGIHLVETVVDKTRPTLLFLPGLTGEGVEGFKSISPVLAEGFNLAAMSFRGRGRSSTPEAGYSNVDHAKDVKLVVESLRAEKLILVATSVSSLYAAEYLTTTTDHGVSAIIFVDHSLEGKLHNEGWAEKVVGMSVSGVPATQTMRKSALYAIEKEADECSYWIEFSELNMPAMLVHAPLGKGLIDEKDLALYGRQSETKIVEIPETDHFIRLRQPDMLHDTMIKFLREV